MHIKKHGVRYQLIKSEKKPLGGGSVQKYIGSFPIEIERIQDVPMEVLSQLSSTEREELNEFFNEIQKLRSLKERGKYLKRVFEVSQVFENLRGSSKEGNNESSKLIDAFNQLMDAIIEDGYAADIAPIALSRLAEAIKHNGVTPQEAIKTLTSLIELEKELSRYGFTKIWQKRLMAKKREGSSKLVDASSIRKNSISDK